MYKSMRVIAMRDRKVNEAASGRAAVKVVVVVLFSVVGVDEKNLLESVYLGQSLG